MKTLKSTGMVIFLAFILALVSVSVNASIREHKVIEFEGSELSVLMPPSNDVLTGSHTDLECFALNIYYEARGESKLGQELVAQVTMNRYRMQGYPMNICKVVTQKAQYSWTRDGKSDMPKNIVAYAKAQIMAVSFMYLGQVLDHPAAFELTNFHALEKTPKSWEGHVVFIEKVMNHSFYTSTRPIVYLLDKYTPPVEENFYASIRI